MPLSATEDIPRREQIVLSIGQVARIAQKEAIDFNSEELSTEQKFINTTRLIKRVPLHELAGKERVTQTGSRIKLNVPGMELIRRAMEQVDIDRGKTNASCPSFAGQFTPAADIEGILNVLNSMVGRATQANRPEVAATAAALAAHIKQAQAASKGEVVFYVFDHTLPHELFHQAVWLGAVEKNLEKRHTVAGAEMMDRSSAYKKAYEHYFSKIPFYAQLPAHRKEAFVREDLAAYIAEGQLKKMGINETEAMEFMLTFLESFGQKVYDEKAADSFPP